MGSCWIGSKGDNVIYVNHISPMSVVPDTVTTILPTSKKRESSAKYEEDRAVCLKLFEGWPEGDQVEFVEQLLGRMCHYQHGHINTVLQPMLQRDFISLLPKKGLDHVAENILSYLDAESLRSAEQVCKEWRRVVAEGMLWKKLIERRVRTDSLWRGLSERKDWAKHLFKPKPGTSHPGHTFYRKLYPQIIRDIE
ncbi:hypothetical protein QYM36_018031, partial [Artemia franciscana]